MGTRCWDILEQSGGVEGRGLSVEGSVMTEAGVCRRRHCLAGGGPAASTCRFYWPMISNPT